MEIEIRKANIDDYKEINELVAEVHQLHFKNRPDVYKDIESPMRKKDFIDILNTENLDIFIAENEYCEVLGYIVVKIIKTQNLAMLVKRTFLYIDDFVIKAIYNRKGTGTVLFEYIKEYAKKQGASSIQLTVWEFNKEAIKFYEKVGMVTRNRRMEISI